MDMSRRMWATISDAWLAVTFGTSGGSLSGAWVQTGTYSEAALSPRQVAKISGFDSGRIMPVGAANKPRAWGALACSYLGTPAS